MHENVLQKFKENLTDEHENMLIVNKVKLDLVL